MLIIFFTCIGYEVSYTSLMTPYPNRNGSGILMYASNAQPFYRNILKLIATTLQHIFFFFGWNQMLLNSFDKLNAWVSETQAFEKKRRILGLLSPVALWILRIIVCHHLIKACLMHGEYFKHHLPDAKLLELFIGHLKK